MPLVQIENIIGSPGYQPAVASFNVCTLDMLEGVVRAAEATRAGIIVGFAERHKGNVDPWALAGAVRACAQRSTAPVAFHLDHATSIEGIQMGIEMGCTSVMIDGSMLPLEENIRLTKKAVDLAHARGIVVEGELGGIGGVEGEVAGGTDEGLYTQPVDAERFVRETGVDLLAIAIGTVHGLYRKPPSLRFEILEDVRRHVRAPLVLHGGTGLSDEDMRRLVEGGIRKVNVYTEISLAAVETLRANLVGASKPQGITDAAVGVREAVCASAERWIMLLDASKAKAERLTWISAN